MKTRSIRIGIITSPAEAAEAAYHALVSSGIRAVWNFAPVSFAETDGILVQNEWMIRMSKVHFID